MIAKINRKGEKNYNNFGTLMKIIEYEDDEGFNQYAEPVYLKNELDILYDLIKADLVEKVEEGK